MILILNCGSQSIKWKIFNEKLKVLKENKIEVLDNNFEKVLEDEISKLRDFEITLIGHRVVRGGGKFSEPLKLNSENLAELEKLSNLAPLHNPYNILGIKICVRFFEAVPQFAVFDTEFFKNLPEKASAYALPKNITDEFGFKRHGFHGISHEFVAKKACILAKKQFNKSKIITCHLGGGCSVAAIKNGKAIDTSMGFSPLSGVVMMTRPGDLDDEIIFKLSEKLGIEHTKEIWNKKSGIKGICGVNNMLELLDMLKNSESPEQSRRAKLAFDVFVYSIQKYIG
ncbi:MAG: acetate kinase, partial [Patescibacteria group bacterium]